MRTDKVPLNDRMRANFVCWTSAIVSRFPQLDKDNSFSDRDVTRWRRVKTNANTIGTWLEFQPQIESVDEQEAEDEQAEQQEKQTKQPTRSEAIFCVDRRDFIAEVRERNGNPAVAIAVGQAVVAAELPSLLDQNQEEMLVASIAMGQTILRTGLGVYYPSRDTFTITGCEMGRVAEHVPVDEVTEKYPTAIRL